MEKGSSNSQKPEKSTPLLLKSPKSPREGSVKGWGSDPSLNLRIRDKFGTIGTIQIGWPTTSREAADTPPKGTVHGTIGETLPNGHTHTQPPKIRGSEENTETAWVRKAVREYISPDTFTGPPALMPVLDPLPQNA